MKENAWS